MCRRVECITHRNGTRIYQTHREREREREQLLEFQFVLFVWQLLESHGLEWNTHTKKPQPTERETTIVCFQLHHFQVYCLVQHFFAWFPFPRLVHSQLSHLLHESFLFLRGSVSQLQSPSQSLETSSCASTPC